MKRIMGFSRFWQTVKNDGYINKAYWQAQYSLFVAGCRDDRMHDSTLALLSKGRK